MPGRSAVGGRLRRDAGAVPIRQIVARRPRSVGRWSRSDSPTKRTARGTPPRRGPRSRGRSGHIRGSPHDFPVGRSAGPGVPSPRHRGRASWSPHRGVSPGMRTRAATLLQRTRCARRASGPRRDRAPTLRNDRFAQCDLRVRGSSAAASDAELVRRAPF